MKVKAPARMLALCCALALGTSACGGSVVPAKTVAATVPQSDGIVPLSDVAMPRPGDFKPPIESPDILVQGQQPLTAAQLATTTGIKAVKAHVQFSLATFYSEENSVTYAAVDPATFRRFTPGPTASLDEVWDRVADGEIAVRPELRKTLPDTKNYVQMGNDTDSQKAHVGAYAPLVDRSKISAVVNERWALKLHMPKGNALLLSTGRSDPGPVLKKLRKTFGKQVSVILLAPNVDPNAAQAAVLTGGSVSQAVGSFTYTANANGSVNPEARWVRDYIRTEQVPIIGTVRCNKAMLPQLRAALTDVVKAGRSASIHPSEYGGCYVPRFIASNPARGLSFHTFGTAIDLNVPGNLRGTRGEMDRVVVAIFKKWGFNWGGDWHYTDPMHFELARIVRAD